MLPQCPPGEIQDCNGNCHPSEWIGDGVCDDGVQVPSDFMCPEFGWDGGDCPCAEDCIQDCNGNLYPAFWVGDGVCDDGSAVPSDFMCEEFNWDDGDCGVISCGDGMVTDCNGNCVSTSFLGDGVCHDSDAINFACAEFSWDEGDCPVQCPEGMFADCDGICFPESFQDYLDDWHCNNTFWLFAGFDGANNINLDCEAFDFDQGDCEVWACTDADALNFYEHATHDDGSCFYGDCPPGTMDCMGNCIPDNWIGTNDCPEGLNEDPIAHLFNGAYPDKLSENIPLPYNSPRGLCVLPNSSAAYVGTDNGIVVVTLSGGNCAASTVIPATGLIYSCAASVDSQYVFAANWTDGRVEVIETATNQIIQSIPTGDGALKVRTSNDGQRVYCSNHNTNSVSVIDVTTLQLIQNIPVGQHPRNIHTSPDDSRLYVANWSDWTMSVIDTETFETIVEVDVDYWPQAVWALPNDDYVMVANFGFDFTYDHISVIRVADWEVVARLQTGAGPEDMMTIGPQGQYLYVSNWGMPCCFYTSSDLCCSGEVDKGTVTVIALPDFDVLVDPDVVPDEIPYVQSTLTTIPLEAEYSFGMAASPDGKALYVVNKDSHNMSVIDFNEFVEPNLEGDLCENAKTLYSPNFCVEDCTTGYSDNYNEFCPFEESGAADLVYRYDAQSTQTVNIDMCPSSYDTKIYIYEGTCGDYNSGEAIYCNDDFCGTNGWRSRLEDVEFVEGISYFIVIDGYIAGNEGHFSLCFENECPGDFDGDSIVSVSDLLFFLTGFGNQFDSADLLEFLAVFGYNCN